MEKGKTDHEVKKGELERKVRDLELELTRKSGEFTTDLFFILNLRCTYNLIAFLKVFRACFVPA